MKENKVYKVSYNLAKSPNRIYGEDSRKNIIDTINELQSKGRNIGEYFVFPDDDNERGRPEIDLCNVSHKFSNPIIEGDILYVDIEPLSTPKGILLQSILWDVSTAKIQDKELFLIELGLRGLGFVDRNSKIVKGYKFISLDVVMYNFSAIPQSV